MAVEFRNGVLHAEEPAGDEIARRFGTPCFRDSSRAIRPAVLGVTALRGNPDSDARTHPYSATGLRETKSGVPHGEAERLYLRAAAMPNVEIVGIGCHIGSLLADPAPFVAAAERLAALVDRLES